MASEKRLQKINELIKRGLGELIQREFERSANQLLTVTEVLTSDDLLTARVKVTIWPQEEREEIFKRLAKGTAFFQSLLNKRLKMRPVPKIVFGLDTRVAEAGKVEKILEKIKDDL